MSCVSACLGMEVGAGGVWDSPMATDYWVKRFGFLWGGGSSGVSGLRAIQVRMRSPRAARCKVVHPVSNVHHVKL